MPRDKLLLASCLLVLLLYVMSPVFADGPSAILVGDTAMVPLRPVLEWFHATVIYTDGRLTAVAGTDTLCLTVGSREGSVNGRSMIVRPAPVLRGGTTYVPLRPIAEALGARVSYDGRSNSVAVADGGATLHISVVPANSPCHVTARSPIPPSDGRHRVQIRNSTAADSGIKIGGTAHFYIAGVPEYDDTRPVGTAAGETLEFVGPPDGHVHFINVALVYTVGDDPTRHYFSYIDDETKHSPVALPLVETWEFQCELHRVRVRNATPEGSGVKIGGCAHFYIEGMQECQDHQPTDTVQGGTLEFVCHQPGHVKHINVALVYTIGDDPIQHQFSYIDDEGSHSPPLLPLVEEWEFAQRDGLYRVLVRNDSPKDSGVKIGGCAHFYIEGMQECDEEIPAVAGPGETLEFVCHQPGHVRRIKFVPIYTAGGHSTESTFAYIDDETYHSPTSLPLVETWEFAQRDGLQKMRILNDASKDLRVKIGGWAEFYVDGRQECDETKPITTGRGETLEFLCPQPGKVSKTRVFLKYTIGDSPAVHSVYYACPGLPAKDCRFTLDAALSCPP
ncbi:MAG: copper amine oxidase N-terminal domain-containing protein [Armatimonadota bacterium]